MTGFWLGPAAKLWRHRMSIAVGMIGKYGTQQPQKKVFNVEDTPSVSAVR
jgi:hypothetical protein